MSKKVKQVDEKKFFRLNEGPAMYGMCENTFAKLVKESGARYEIGTRMVLVNKKEFDEFLESFRVVS